MPPLTGVAVKVTGVPLQTWVWSAEMLTPTGKSGFTIIVIMLLVVGLPVAQVAFEVITTDT